jgi:hypothetical protein
VDGVSTWSTRARRVPAGVPHGDVTRAAAAFRALHEHAPLVLPNAWDAALELLDDGTYTSMNDALGYGKLNEMFQLTLR